MNHPSRLGFVLVLAAVAVTALLVNAHQWRGRLLLRTELDLARAELSNLSRLKAENEQLRARQVSPTELERLRADHAALPRLRAELEALTKAAKPAR